MSVDRSNGRITSVRLPDFDAGMSVVSWYRDYAAYCGVSEDKKVYAVVLQLGRRKPSLHQLVAKAAAASEVVCGSPVWERDPARVSFKFNGDQALTFAVDSNAQESSADEPAEAAE